MCTFSILKTTTLVPRTNWYGLGDDKTRMVFCDMSRPGDSWSICSDINGVLSQARLQTSGSYNEYEVEDEVPYSWVI